MSDRSPSVRALTWLRVAVGAFLVCLAIVLLRLDPCDDASYPQSAASPYVLPWTTGGAHRVHQGNCTYGNTHDKAHNASFAYDFEMPVGTPIAAARGGVVLSVDERWSDSDHDEEHGNRVILDHGDGTYAIYGHLTRDGAEVGVGERVVQGRKIARSGSSGLVATPHLHFMVFECPLEVAGRRLFCSSVPVSFQGGPTGPLAEGAWVGSHQPH